MSCNHDTRSRFTRFIMCGVWVCKQCRAEANIKLYEAIKENIRVRDEFTKQIRKLIDES